MDWTEMGRRLDRIQAAMIHDEHTALYGPEFTGEALRRLLEHPASGFVTDEEHMRVLEVNRSADRASAERAQAELREAHARYERLIAEARCTIATALRRHAGSVPGKLRREGVLLAANWIDPQPATGDVA